MKKLLGIVVLGLLLSGNAFASDIKIKRIECKNPKNKNLFNSKFIIISNDGNGAKLFEALSPYRYLRRDYKVSSGLYFIHFFKDTNLNPEFRIIRSSGELKKGWTGQKLFGICNKMSEDFDPVAYFDEQTKKNIAEKKKSDKF